MQLSRSGNKYDDTSGCFDSCDKQTDKDSVTTAYTTLAHNATLQKLSITFTANLQLSYFNSIVSWLPQ